MVQISIEDDVNAFLLQKARVVGESASDILRRELRIPRSSLNSTPLQSLYKDPPAPPKDEDSSPLLEFLQSPLFLAQSDGVSQFVALLSWLHERHKDIFRAVLGIEGRDRKYFGLTKVDVEGSGTSVTAKPIPNSPFWVITNNDTPTKRKILSRVMRLFRYPMNEIVLASSHIR
jgi:negative modulator of initiation of replication